MRPPRITYMTQRSKQWLKFAVRWGIAVGGIVYVLLGITFRDRVTILGHDNHPDHVQVLGDAREEDSRFRVLVPNPEKPGDYTERVHPRSELWARPDVAKVKAVLREGAQPERVKVLAVRPAYGARRDRAVAEFLVEDPATEAGIRLDPKRVIGADEMTVSSPRVEIGLFRMVREADRAYLLGALFILPLSYLITSIRWHLLLKVLDIHLPQARTFILNMVGAFYNAFMPGTTGGDVIKAYYAAKHTVHRTRAVMSVLVDRAVGLLGLVVLGGAMAAYQYQIKECRRVALISLLLLLAVAIGLFVFYNPFLRRVTGLSWILRRLPMQRQVTKAVEAMELFGRRPLVVLGAMVLSFPVHITSILSANLAGRAFGLPLDDVYYWAIVPVIALVGAIPISPQGAGVMEFFAVQLTRGQGVTVSQAFALTMSIRLTQMFWNLVAGAFVLRGDYRAPTEKEQETLESDVTDRGQSSEVRGQENNGEMAGVELPGVRASEPLPEAASAPPRGA